MTKVMQSISRTIEVIKSFAEKILQKLPVNFFAKFMKRFQTQILTIYRFLSLGVLSSIVVGVLVYVSLLVFYALNWSWATPMILSPTQEMVLSFQPSVAAIQTQLSQQEVTLATLRLTQNAKTEQLQAKKKLLERFQHAKTSESAYLRRKGYALSQIASEQTSDMENLRQSKEQAAAMLKQIDEEEKAGFLTKYDANRERAAANERIAALTSAKAALIQARERQEETRNLAATLTGGGASLSALNAIEQEEQLKSSITQLEIDIKAGDLSIKALNESLVEGKRILDVAKDSPKYKALTKPVTVAFVPYENLSNAEIDSPVYDCMLKFFLCHQVGTVTKIFAAEEYGVHPLFRTNLKGRLVGIQYTDADASRLTVVFIGSKPLFL